MDVTSLSKHISMFTSPWLARGWVSQEISLKKYFDIIPPPSTTGDIISCWKSLLGLVKALHNIHASKKIHGQKIFEDDGYVTWSVCMNLLITDPFKSTLRYQARKHLNLKIRSRISIYRKVEDCRFRNFRCQMPAKRYGKNGQSRIRRRHKWYVYSLLFMVFSESYERTG